MKKKGSNELDNENVEQNMMFETYILCKFVSHHVLK